MTDAEVHSFTLDSLDFRKQSARRLGEVIAVAILDGGAERLHGMDVQVYRTTTDAVATGVADDDLADARQQGTQQDEAGTHASGGLERHEVPVDVAGTDFVGVGLRVVYNHTEIAQDLGHE